MSIAAGTKLGSYEVVAPLGAGGMGEVYQAHNTKLGRDVAIKVLPEALAHEPDRLSRFQSEAKMLAALNSRRLRGLLRWTDSLPCFTPSLSHGSLRAFHQVTSSDFFSFHIIRTVFNLRRHEFAGS